ncbi:MAG TPA: 5'-3' exonuclease H3TH domain-containing protein, partial [Clostridia bacterium]|nr:5'-3' exonuclease H3TH domain-containing protein [Clostridia bacterium]
MNKIILLDSNSIIHRAYHALPSLNNSKGQATGAIYGFLNILISLIKKEQPTHIAAAFDLKGATFRNEMYQAYKATRKPMEEELASQFEPIKKLLRLMGIKIVELQGYEGDDILGTLAKRFSEDTIIVTGDRDSFQLVSDSTRIYWTKKGISDIEEIGLEKLKEMGFTPQSYIDYKALRGDPSDNIPGIAGVGEKTAISLLEKYKSLDEVLNCSSEISGKVGDTIRNSREIALLSRALATINCDAPLDCTLKCIEFNDTFSTAVKDYLSELEITSVLKRMKFNEHDAEEDKQEIQEKQAIIDKVIIKDETTLDLVFKNSSDKIAILIDERIS